MFVTSQIFKKRPESKVRTALMQPRSFHLPVYSHASFVLSEIGHRFYE